jgi:hypothetical protein
MADIYWGIALLVLLTAGCLALGIRLARRASRRQQNLMALGAFGLLLLFLYLLNQCVWLMRWLPLTNLIVLGNFVPLAAGFLAGLAWHRAEKPVWRRWVTVPAILIVCAYAAFRPLLQAPVRGGNRWSRSGVCLQTTTSTCSAACAATLLREHGIEATEEEMIRLCLTRKTGTLFYGLFRGLTLKTEGTPWRVEAFRGDLARLREMTDGPVILTVGLRPNAGLDPRYERDWGWLPGVRHAVVLYRFLPGDRVEIGDPAIGRERWTVDAVRDLWTGEGMRLVAR